MLRRTINISAQISYFAFFSAVIFSGSVRYIAALALITAIIASLFNLKSIAQIPIKNFVVTKKYVAICATFLIIALLNILLGRSGAEGYGLAITIPVTILISLSVVQFCSESKSDLYETLIRVSFVHSMILILISFLQVHFFDLPRAHGDVNAINYSQLLMISGGLVAVSLFQDAREHSGLKRQIILLLWLLLLMYAVHITGTRGSIIAFIPMLAGFLIITAFDQHRSKLFTISILLAVSLVISIVVLNSDRFALAVVEVEKSLNGLRYQGSVGFRLGMWEEAWYLIRQNPVFGHGLFQFHEITSLPETNPIQRYNHVHNQYLDIWMKTGIGGLVFIIAYLAYPISIGLKLIYNKTEVRVGLSLLWLGGSFATFGLTEVFIFQTDTFTLLAIYLPMLMMFLDEKLKLIIAPKNERLSA